MEQNMPIPGTRYFDREKRQYQLMLVADHSKTNEKMAVYQALFGGFEYFTEPLGIFMTEKTEVSSEIGRTGGSKWSRPAVLQTEAANPVQDPIAKPENQKLKTEDSSVCQPVQPHHQTLEEEMANPILLEFLDAETLEEKYQVIKSLGNSITNRLIDDFAVVLDLVIPDGSLDSRYMQLLSSVRTMQKFETNRFRR
ncbi:hypothetical protein IMSAGC012_01273 [Lachnospiraceae bacterium]|nr:hypothetical protein IMSAGC012_01273 [Lachnospiraceae bacterium]